MNVKNFAFEINTNMDFIFKLIELNHKYPDFKYFRILDENGDKLDVGIIDASFSTKKRNGLCNDKQYFCIKCLNYSHLYLSNSEVEFSVNKMIEKFQKEIDESIPFQKPVVLNKSDGKYYNVIGLGIDVFKNIILYVKRIS